MNSNAQEIQNVLHSLGYSPELFRRLEPEESDLVYNSAMRHFVPGRQVRWWWEHFPSSIGVHFARGDGWNHLVNVVPNADEQIWFIAEDFVAPEYSVWETSVKAASAILGQCYRFEYYLIQKQFNWLLCENHHNVMVAVGDEIEDRLENYNPE